jgi:HPt (histidine-containing phosphotransfer) domain-containing protein
MKYDSPLPYEAVFDASPVYVRENGSEAAVACLARVPGLNMEYCQSLLGGNADKYLEVLKLFIETHADDMTRLEVSLGGGDNSAAHRLVHSLKGTAATLGIDHLAEMARRLEEMLQYSQYETLEGDAIHAEINTIKLELAFIVAALLPTISNSYYENL